MVSRVKLRRGEPQLHRFKWCLRNIYLTQCWRHRQEEEVGFAEKVLRFGGNP